MGYTYIRKVAKVKAIQYLITNKREVFEFLAWNFWDKNADIAQGPKFKYEDGKLLVLTTTGYDDVHQGDWIVDEFCNGDTLSIYTNTSFREAFTEKEDDKHSF